MQINLTNKYGFTLIEASIVLIIIGLVLGGIITGIDLISAAAVRSQISQIEGYNSAVRTFQAKYGYLPGDMPDPPASNYGFLQRGVIASGGSTICGHGDGNGVIEGNWDGGSGALYSCRGLFMGAGETVGFWADLNAANLIEGGFAKKDQLTVAHTAFQMGVSYATSSPSSSSNNLAQYLPEAKIGNNNSVYVWSGGALNCVSGVCQTSSSSAGGNSNGVNYFGISITPISVNMPNGSSVSTVGITVKQAYSMDMKMDDGLPLTGKVTAVYDSLDELFFASGTPSNNGSYPIVMPGTSNGNNSSSTYTCYDNSSGSIKYSMPFPNNVNCALSFEFK